MTVENFRKKLVRAKEHQEQKAVRVSNSRQKKAWQKKYARYTQNGFRRHLYRYLHYSIRNNASEAEIHLARYDVNHTAGPGFRFYFGLDAYGLPYKTKRFYGSITDEEFVAIVQDLQSMLSSYGLEYKYSVPMNDNCLSLPAKNYPTITINLEALR